ncbi:short-chain dehydrogenase/reductase SDR [Bradyrhizobiaceae bacterium SG-6C]|nr:short-chain dehydrogenase/reductase SDR [Bradyrhizobiaceae bacterium SG-6C]
MMKNKVAIITGASRGIGSRLVERFLGEGASVVACARTADRLEALKLSVGDAPLEVVAADAARPEDVAAVVARAVEAFGGVNIVVNNAGAAGPTTPVESLSLEDWTETVNSNLTSAFLFVRETVPLMKTRGGGAVVNIGSMTGKKPLVFRAPYAAAKMGLIGLTRTLAEELGPDGIRVNTVCPGTVDGERLEEVLVQQADKRGMTVEAITAFARGMSPLKTFVSADDVAELVLFLASDRSARMTGQDINISAGQITW